MNVSHYSFPLRTGGSNQELSNHDTMQTINTIAYSMIYPMNPEYDRCKHEKKKKIVLFWYGFFPRLQCMYRNAPLHEARSHTTLTPPAGQKANPQRRLEPLFGTRNKVLASHRFPEMGSNKEIESFLYSRLCVGGLGTTTATRGATTAVRVSSTSTTLAARSVSIEPTAATSSIATPVVAVVGTSVGACLGTSGLDGNALARNGDRARLDGSLAASHGSVLDKGASLSQTSV